MAKAGASLELTVPELCCADEARQIEGALGRLDGVRAVRALVGSRTALISYDETRIAPEAIRGVVESLGMTVAETRAAGAARGRALADRLGWAFVSAVALVALVGVAGELLGLVDVATERLPGWLPLTAVLVGGYPIFRSVARALRHRRVTSHALMTLGIIGALGIGQYAAAAVIVFFMRLADWIEGFTTERSRAAIRELLELAPATAHVERDGRALDVPAEEVARGEVVLVKPGERIPVDGVVVEGRASVDQAPITGESVPVARVPGDRVFAATICERGALRIRTERVGRDTTFGQILRLVEQAEASKAPVQRFADRFTAHYIPAVLGIAVLTFLVRGSVTASVATLLVACSCAIAMATPITVLAAVGRAARHGIVIKGGRYLEALAKVDTLVVDKTGTLTRGRPEVTHVIAAPGQDEDTVLALAAAVEGRSEHPLATGILKAAARRQLTIDPVEGFAVHPGGGVTATVRGLGVACGTEELMAVEGLAVPPGVRVQGEELSRGGASVVVVAHAGQIVGLIALADTVRTGVDAALARLRALGVERQLLLTGDRGEVAAAVASPLGLEFEAGLLPEDKIRAIERLQRKGRTVAMIGDGINDAPALARADVGIAMGVAGSDAAIEAAHVALMRDDWEAVPEAVRIGRRAFRTIKQNLWFTAAYNAVGISLAAAGWLPPIAAAAAQALPDVAVMLNASRLWRRR